MKNGFRILGFLACLAQASCLPQAARNAAAPAESRSPDAVSSSYQPGPGGSMPTGTLAPGAEVGTPDFVALVTGAMNVDCVDSATGKIRVTLKGKVMEKYGDGSTRECTHCHAMQIKIVYEDQGVRRWRPIALDDQGSFAGEPFEVDWSTARFFFDRETVWIPGEANECPADSCVEHASPAELDLAPQPAIQDAPECPSGLEPHIVALVPGKPPVLTLFGTRKNICKASGGKTRVAVRGMLSWFNEATGVGSNHCAGQTADCPANETILQTWRLRVAYRKEGVSRLTQTVDAQFETHPWDIGQYLWAEANLVTSDPSSIRFFIFDTVEQKVIQSLPARLEELGPEKLEACFQPDLTTAQPK